MNTLGERQLQTHVAVAECLLIVDNAVFLLVGVFVFLLLVGVGFSIGDAGATGVLLTLGTLVGLLLAALSIPGIAAGAGLLARKTWGRMLTIVVAIPSLANWPFGTAIRGLVLCALLQQGSAGSYGPYCRS